MHHHLTSGFMKRISRFLQFDGHFAFAIFIVPQILVGIKDREYPED